MVAERESPATLAARRAEETDQLGGQVDSEDRSLSDATQARRPDTRTVEARHREIARRYARAGGRRSGGQIAYIRLNELRRLLRGRGLSDVEAAQFIEAELENFGQWPAGALGDKLELTFDEKIKFSIRTIQCFDRPKHEVDAYYHEKKKERDRMKKAEQRAGKQRTIPVTARAAALLAAIQGRGWVTVPDLAREAVGLAGFRRKSADQVALRQAVHRATRELREVGLVEFEQLPNAGAHRTPINRIRAT